MFYPLNYEGSLRVREYPPEAGQPWAETTGASILHTNRKNQGKQGSHKNKKSDNKMSDFLLSVQ